MTQEVNHLQTLYDHVLYVWNGKIDDDFEIHCDLYYQMFSDCYDED